MAQGAPSGGHGSPIGGEGGLFGCQRGSQGAFRAASGAPSGAKGVQGALRAASGVPSGAKRAPTDGRLWRPHLAAQESPLRRLRGPVQAAQGPHWVAQGAPSGSQGGPLGGQGVASVYQRGPYGWLTDRPGGPIGDFFLEILPLPNRFCPPPQPAFWIRYCLHCAVHWGPPGGRAPPYENPVCAPVKECLKF